MSDQPMTGRQLMGLDPPATEIQENPVEPVEPLKFVDASTFGALDDHVSRETIFPSALMPVYSWGADCIGPRAGLLSLKTPVIWPYVTGEGVAWTEQEIQLFRQAGAKVYLVNQGEPDQPFFGDEFDVEAGAITPEQMIGIVQARRERKWSTRIYGTYSTYRDLTEELAILGIRRSVWWRIADWNFSQHLAELELWGDVYAGQWASPTSNPGTLLPFTGLTLAQANADLNVVLKESTGWKGLWYSGYERDDTGSRGTPCIVPLPQTTRKVHRNADRPDPH